MFGGSYQRHSFTFLAFEQIQVSLFCFFFYDGLMSASMVSWGNDTGVYMCVS